MLKPTYYIGIIILVRTVRVNLMTETQKEIRHLQRAKRTTKETLADMQTLSDILRKGEYPRGINFLGPGSGNFYQCVMVSYLALRRMKKKTKANAKDWQFHDDRIQWLKKIAGI